MNKNNEKYDYIPNNFNVLKMIGKGSFGIVLKSFDKLKKKNVALKIETYKNLKEQRLDKEYFIYKKLQYIEGIPKIYNFIEKKDLNKSILVLEYLGPTLEELFNFCDRKFSLKTTLLIIDQLITRIENIHCHGILHKDLKPENFLLGHNNKDLIYLIDFGLSVNYINNRNFSHNIYNDNNAFVGTLRYASINNHEGIEQSRRDDLESLGYIFIYFLTGTLPWKGLKGKTNKNTQELIYNKKKNTTIKDLCKNLPIEIYKYMNYCRELKYYESPNYEYLRNLFYKLYLKNNFKKDNIYDWNLKAKKLISY